MSKETGNIVIEVSFNDKPSALSTTKAYRWVFYTKEEMIVTTPERIKQSINKHSLSTVKFIGRGDYHPKKLVTLLGVLTMPALKHLFLRG